MIRYLLENKEIGYTVEVRVYQRRREMQRFLKGCHPRKAPEIATWAAACGEGKIGAWSRLCFSREDLQHGTIAHECMHAAMNIFKARRGRLPRNRVGEEFVTTQAGLLVSAVLRELHHRGISVRF